MKQLDSHEGLHCANCGTPMQGAFCHECGQSIHSVIKPVHGMLEDTMDIVFHVDGRVLHTIPPLFARPGFLTLEYFAGRRMRYVAPFRLMFVLCLLAFFVCHLAVENSQLTLDSSPPVQVTNNPFEDANTPAAVKLMLQQQLSNMERARHQVGVFGSLAAPELDAAEQVSRRQAAQRLQALGEKSAAVVIPSSPVSAPASLSTTDRERGEIHTKISDDWLTSPSRIEIVWLPGFVDARLSRALDQIKANLLAMKSPGASRQETYARLRDSFFSVLPQTMFVMIPLFALLLKLFYIFRRRLYMEHLIVALHSHAYLFLSLLLGILLSAVSNWMAPHASWINHPLKWLTWALVLWIPIYLLIMQKRIYRQGWPMTVLKFWCIGWLYIWLLAAALLVAAVLGAIH